MSLDGPRLDKKDCWLRHWGSGSPQDSVCRFGSSVCFGSVGLDRLDSPRLDKKDCWSGHWGSGSHANRGENQQHRFVQLQVRRGESAAQIFRRTWAGRWTVQARQESSSRGHADETALV